MRTQVECVTGEGSVNLQTRHAFLLTFHSFTSPRQAAAALLAPAVAF
jgi:hypothetical protein